MASLHVASAASTSSTAPRISDLYRKETSRSPGRGRTSSNNALNDARDEEWHMRASESTGDLIKERGVEKQWGDPVKGSGKERGG